MTNNSQMSYERHQKPSRQAFCYSISVFVSHHALLCFVKVDSLCSNHDPLASMHPYLVTSLVRSWLLKHRLRQ